MPAKFSFPGGHLLLLNCYFPTNLGNDTFDDTELQNILGEIKRLINEANCPNIFIAGDLNCNYSKNNKFVRIVRSFFDDLRILVFWNNPDDSDGHKVHSIDYTHTYVNNGITYYSTIDHFISNF